MLVWLFPPHKKYGVDLLQGLRTNPGREVHFEQIPLTRSLHYCRNITLAASRYQTYDNTLDGALYIDRTERLACRLVDGRRFRLWPRLACRHC